ncbi:MAG TPA: LysR family transcriptional regulator [Clostridia bacterium]|nr:LysR family transcriptional regulator [Clostridia bacterium]
MQLRDIQYVVTIADKRSFSQAAEALYVSQPALSQAIKRLEAEIGTALFSRKRKKVFLTRAGEIFLHDAKQILQLSNHLLIQMENIHSLKQGSLHIGMTPLFGRFYFAQPYKAFHALYPGVDISVHETSSIALERLLAAGTIDIALIPLPLENKSFQYEEIVSEETFLAVPADHRINRLIPRMSPGEFGTVDMAFFCKDDFIMLNPGQRLRELGMDACRAAGFEPHIVFETMNVDSANALVAAGIGISFIPYMIFTTRSDNGGAVYYHINGINATRNLVAAYEDDSKLSNAAKAFIRITRDLLR